MNIDHYFEIGKLHTICQDYSYSEINQKDGYGCAVSSDGCSSSFKYAPVDFGARLLTHSLLKVINKMAIASYPAMLSGVSGKGNFYIETRENKEILNSVCSLAYYNSKNIEYSIHDFGSQILDCTLAFCLSNGERRHHIVFVGDGIAVVKRKNENLEEETVVYVINYESGAPFYMSYLLDSNRLAAYRKEFGNFRKTVTKYIFDADCKNLQLSCIEIIPLEEIYTLSLLSNSISSISVCSDGLQTYHNGANHIEQNEVFKNAFSYKNYQGEFVKRRMLSFKRQCEKDKIEHDDDISVATIHFGE